MRTAILTLIALAVPLPGLPQDPAAPSRRALNTLLTEDWEFKLRDSPERATGLGDHRFDDRLTDLSPEAIARRQAHEREMLRRIRAIPRTHLRGQDLLSHDLFRWEKEQEVAGQQFPREVLALDQLDGPHLAFPRLVDQMPFVTVKEYQSYLARLAAFPQYLGQVIELLGRGVNTGWTLPAVPLRSVPAQIDGQIVEDPTRSPLYLPFTRIPEGIATAERERLAASGPRLIADSVLPALRRLRRFLADTYLPAARSTTAATALSDGQAFYAWRVRTSTTTDLSPAAIHRVGVSEVTRIHEEMERVIARIGFQGTFGEFLTHLRTDPRFYHTSPEALVTGYRDVAKRADAGLPSLFVTLPRLTYGVRAFPNYEAPAQTTARYYEGAADGSRPGYFMVNTYKLDSRPIYEMEALTLHEAVPGHHLQIARAREVEGLHPWRRNADFLPFVEGWGLYAESLGPLMGFYTDPYSKFGQLSYEMWRACRLVVDTGIHALGWTRQQAIDYLLANTAKSEQDIEVEVDRYIVWPGQALGYKLGELKIRELRAAAERALGERFDIRRFHNVILDNGPLPLAVLERVMRDWIVSNRKR